MADAETIGAGIGTRIVDVRTAIERHASFVIGLDDPPADLRADTTSVATEFVLRALNAGTQSTNHGIMTFLKDGDVSFRALCDHAQLGQAAVWESVNDLVQAGLVGRALEHDRTGLTAAGEELLAFIDVVTQAAHNVAEVGRQ